LEGGTSEIDMPNKETAGLKASHIIRTTVNAISAAAVPACFVPARRFCSA
jgi:hypothetical protein